MKRNSKRNFETLVAGAVAVLMAAGVVASWLDFAGPVAGNDIAPPSAVVYTVPQK